MLQALPFVYSRSQAVRLPCNFRAFMGSRTRLGPLFAATALAGLTACSGPLPGSANQDMSKQHRKAQPTTCGTTDGKPSAAASPSGSPSPTPTHQDVAYAGVSDAQKLDLYLPPDSGKNTPLIINVHGGSFRQGDKTMEKPNIVHQLDKGYASASVNYRLTGEAGFPAGVQDVKAAVRWLRAHAAPCGFDPDRIVIWGESAGGYMAQMVAITGGQKTMFDDPDLGHPDVSAAVQAAVVWYAPNNFGTMDAEFRKKTPASCKNAHPHDPAASSESQWLGAALPTIPEKVRKADPLNYLDTARSLPPFSIATGDADCLVPHQQSEDLYKAVRKAGAHAELSIVPGVGHGPVVDRAEVSGALDFLDRTFGR